jgi:hypothetical protein
VAFTKGQSGNPGGRSKGFAKIIKAKCGDDYEQLVEGLYVIAFGDAAAREAFFGEPLDVKAKDRLAALIALRDSGPGKPTQAHDIELPPDVPLFVLPDGCHVSVAGAPPDAETVPAHPRRR